ncbi:hypothetical protein [Neomoorella thermoacetica]|uniref:Uncharacterized protein n=2 Tax=Neomoorella thermoacetica TaxID=1525 RepID=Q2RKQ4_MOOTA|nr:hypothetical protein [Moorella thermoacetica]AKX93403.1 hypothetical protein MOTHE_c05990 [Moorella thermoacetica]AKX96053.1 hypothetical protein MOTHA_c06960 [Moorella thermoacetica]OIQ55265.1 hypothetical protein MOCA_18370 [Moorella thermoacetica]QCZ99863.1 hypothetical protein MothHH_00710 [Moorella thermoacetica]TYL07483.1 hypothetical protein MOOCA_22480 [Moorella thermoacetica]
MDTQYAVRDSLQKSDNIPQREIARHTGLSFYCAAGLAGIDGNILVITWQAWGDFLLSYGEIYLDRMYEFGSRKKLLGTRNNI